MRTNTEMELEMELERCEDLKSATPIVDGIKKLIHQELEIPGNNRLLPSARYERDPDFRYLVDAMLHMIVKAKFTPTELREAATLAAIKYERQYNYLKMQLDITKDHCIRDQDAH